MLCKMDDKKMTQIKSLPKIALSGFPQETKVELAKGIKRLGGIYADKEVFDEQCSHIVCKKPSRSEKFLAGVASGKWLLHYNYITESVVANRWLPEDKYEWSISLKNLSPESVHEYLSAPQTWRLHRATYRTGPFFGWIAAMLVDQQAKKNVYKRLLRLGDARVGELSPHFQNESVKEIARCVTHIFVDENNAGRVSELVKHGVMCLDPVYIGEYLLKDPPPDPRLYIVKQTVPLKSAPQLVQKHCALSTYNGSALNRNVPHKSEIPSTSNSLKACVPNQEKHTDKCARRLPKDIKVSTVNSSNAVTIVNTEYKQPSKLRQMDEQKRVDKCALIDCDEKFVDESLSSSQTVKKVGDSGYTSYDRLSLELIQYLSSQPTLAKPTSAPSLTTRQKTLLDTPSKLPRMGVSATTKKLSISKTNSGDGVLDNGELDVIRNQAANESVPCSPLSQTFPSNTLKRLTPSGISTTPKRLRQSRVSKGSPSSVKSHDIRKFYSVTNSKTEVVDKTKKVINNDIQDVNQNGIACFSCFKSQTDDNANGRNVECDKHKSSKRHCESILEENSVKKRRQCLTRNGGKGNQPMSLSQISNHSCEPLSNSPIFQPIVKLDVNNVKTSQPDISDRNDCDSESSTRYSLRQSQKGLEGKGKPKEQGNLSGSSNHNNTVKDTNNLLNHVEKNEECGIDESKHAKVADLISKFDKKSAPNQSCHMLQSENKLVDSASSSTLMRKHLSPVVKLIRLSSNEIQKAVKGEDNENTTLCRKAPDTFSSSTANEDYPAAVNKTSRKKTIRNLSKAMSLYKLNAASEANSAAPVVPSPAEGIVNEKPFSKIDSQPIVTERVKKVKAESQSSNQFTNSLSQFSECTMDSIDDSHWTTISVKDAIRKLKKVGLKSLDPLWSPVCYRQQPLQLWEQRLKNETKPSYEMSLPYTNLFNTCFEEEKYLAALDILESSLSSQRYPRSITIRNVLVQIVMKGDSPSTSQRAADILHSILDVHPPHKPALVQMYAAVLRQPEQEPHCGHEWEFISQIISGCLQSEDLETQRKNRLALQFVVAIFESDFHIYMAYIKQYQRHRDKLKKTKPCLFAQLIWSMGTLSMGCMNNRCNELFNFLMEAIQLKPFSMNIVEMLQSLIGILGESSLHADNMFMPVAGSHLPQKAKLLTKELAYWVSRNLSEDNENLATLLKSTSLPWMTIVISETLLDSYIDKLAPPRYQDLSMPPSMMKIVSRYFYLLPSKESEIVTPQKLQGRRYLGTPQKCLPNGSPLKVHSSPSVKVGMNDKALKKKMTEVNKTNKNGETPLHVACKKNNVMKVQELLQIPGINVNKGDNFGWTPLHEACNHGNLDCVRLLLDYRPPRTISAYFKQAEELQKRVDILAASADGTTALHDAVQNNAVEVVRVLMTYGGDKLLTVKDANGKTAVDYMSEQNEAIKEALQGSVDDSRLDAKDCVLNDSLMSDSQSNILAKSSITLPPEEEYRKILGQDQKKCVPQNLCSKYITLVCALLLNYIKLHKIKNIYLLIDDDEDEISFNLNRGQKQSRIKVSDDECSAISEDLKVFRSLKQHITGFVRHLRRISDKADHDGLKEKESHLRCIGYVSEE